MKQLKQIAVKTPLKGVKMYKGESIEQFVERAQKTGAPIETTSPIIYTNRADGVMPEYNIRTDKWEQSASAMNAVAEGHRKTRSNNIQKRANKNLKGAETAVNTDGQSNSKE